MKVPEKLSRAFGKDFENLIGEFAVGKQMIPDLASLHSVRFLARSVVPHVERLSSLFNREKAHVSAAAPGKAVQSLVDKAAQSSGLAPYWKDSSNPENLRLAYFL